MLLPLECLPQEFKTIYDAGVIVNQMYCFFSKRKVITTYKKIVELCRQSQLPCDNLFQRLLYLEMWCPTELRLQTIHDENNNIKGSTDFEITFPRIQGVTTGQSAKRLKIFQQSISNILKSIVEQQKHMEQQKWSTICKGTVWPDTIVVTLPPLPRSFSLVEDVPIIPGAAAVNNHSNSTAINRMDDGDESQDINECLPITTPVSLGELGGAICVLDTIKAQSFYQDQVVHAEVLPSRTAKHARLTPESFAQLADILQDDNSAQMRLGMVLSGDALYSHQAEAIGYILSKKHCVVSTSTASGKSVIYNVPVVSEVLKNPLATALYLFPTKALAQDQLRVLHKLVGADDERNRLPVHVCTLDGDTPREDRNHIRDTANICLSNPDLMHLTLLPNHVEWKRLFMNLRFVVIDESHTYHGIFGSHVSMHIH